MCHCAKFREDRSNSSRDMADFRIFKMAAVRLRHLGFVLRRVFGGLCDCAKFGCNLRSNFDYMRVKLENAYSRPQNRDFCGILPPKWGAV